MRYKYSFSKDNKTGGSKMRKKGSVKKSLLKALAVAAEDEMDINIYSWPPICSSLLYQPERPVLDVNRIDSTGSNNADK